MSQPLVNLKGIVRATRALEACNRARGFVPDGYLMGVAEGNDLDLDECREIRDLIQKEKHPAFGNMVVAV